MKKRLIYLGIAVIILWTFLNIALFLYYRIVHYNFDISLTYPFYVTNNFASSDILVGTSNDEGLALDKAGNTLFTLEECDSVSIYDQIIVCSESGHADRYFDLNGTEIEMAELYRRIESGAISSELYLRPAGDSMWGFTNEIGLWIIPPQFFLKYHLDDIKISENLTLLPNETGHIMLVNLSDFTVQELCRQDGVPSINGFQNGILLYRKNDITYNSVEDRSCTFIRKDNQELFERFPFEDAHDFSENKAAVQKNGFWGYIDINGKFIIEPQYISATNFDNGLAIITAQDGKSHIINAEGTSLYEFDLRDYTLCGEIHDDLVLVKKNNLFSLFDLSGNIIGTPQNQEWEEIIWTGHYWSLFGNQQYGLALPRCKKIVVSDEPITVEEGFVLCRDGDKYQLYNFTTGEKIFSSTWIEPFSEGLSLAKNWAGYGYIDQNGDWVIYPQYDEATSFVDGIAYVRSGNRTGFIFNPLK